MAIDGDSAPNSDNFWATNSPAGASWAIFNLIEERNMNSLVLITGGSDNDLKNEFGHFKVTLKKKVNWISLSALQVKVIEDPSAQIASDGSIILSKKIKDITLQFTKVINVESIRLDLPQAPTNTPDISFVLREMIPGTIVGKF